MLKSKLSRSSGLALVVVMSVTLLLAACGDNTATQPAPTTAAAVAATTAASKTTVAAVTTSAVTTPAGTTAAKTTSAAATTAAAATNGTGSAANLDQLISAAKQEGSLTTIALPHDCRAIALLKKGTIPISIFENLRMPSGLLKAMRSSIITSDCENTAMKSLLLNGRGPSISGDLKKLERNF